MQVFPCWSKFSEFFHMFFARSGKQSNMTIIWCDVHDAPLEIRISRSNFLPWLSSKTQDVETQVGMLRLWSVWWGNKWKKKLFKQVYDFMNVLHVIIDKLKTQSSKTSTWKAKVLGCDQIDCTFINSSHPLEKLVAPIRALLGRKADSDLTPRVLTITVPICRLARIVKGLVVPPETRTKAVQARERCHQPLHYRS